MRNFILMYLFRTVWKNENFKKVTFWVKNYPYKFKQKFNLSSKLKLKNIFPKIIVLVSLQRF